MKLKTLTFLDHFIAEGKYHLMVTKADSELIKKELKFLKFKKFKKGDKFTEVDYRTKVKNYRNYQISLTKNIPAKILADYWKFRFFELQEEHTKLTSGINSLLNS